MDRILMTFLEISIESFVEEFRGGAEELFVDDELCFLGANGNGCEVFF
jgi:hypothetical protein